MHELSHQTSVVILSLFVAVFSSAVSYLLASRGALGQIRNHRLWIIGSALCLAVGLWSMHFLGILALRIPIRLHLDPWLTAASFLPAVVGAWALLVSARQPLVRPGPMLLGSGGLASGVVCMHYLGMAAIDHQPAPTFSLVSIWMASAWAWLASLVAYLAYQRLLSSKVASTARQVVFTSSFMGLAITGMHYLAMSGTSLGTQGLCLTSSLVSGSASPAGDLQGLQVAAENLWLAAIIFLLLMVVQVAGLLAAIYDARLEDQHMRQVRALASENRRLDERADDLSARLTHEQSIHQAALDATQDVIFAWCGFERTFFVSPAVHALWGLPSDHALHALEDLQAFMVPADRLNFEEAIAAMVSGERADHSQTLEIRRGDGQQRWLSVRARVTTRTRRPMIVGAFTDITALKQRELEALAVADQQRELAAFRGQIVRIVSHELRTPLTVLATGTELLRSRCQPSPGLPPEKMASYFQNMDDALEQVKAVLAEVLQYNKLETGELVNTPRCLDLLGQIDQTVKMVCKGAQVPLERVRLSLDVQTSQLMCDPFLLEQVLRNLLTNAVKYGLGKPVFLRAVADEDRLSIEVEDQGLGVSDDLLERLFQPFARGANAAHLPGTGLGLSIAHRAASVMGGELRLLRSNNTGSVFGLSLPVQPCSPGPI